MKDAGLEKLILRIYDNMTDVKAYVLGKAVTGGTGTRQLLTYLLKYVMEWKTPDSSM